MCSSTDRGGGSSAEVGGRRLTTAATRHRDRDSGRVAHDTLGRRLTGAVTVRPRRRRRRRSHDASSRATNPTTFTYDGVSRPLRTTFPDETLRVRPTRCRPWRASRGSWRRRPIS